MVWGENQIFAVRPGASGEISPQEKETPGEYIAWWQKAGPYHPTPLIIDDTLYMLLDRGFMAAYNAKTGETVYDKKRIPNGRAFTSSPWSYAGKLFCVNEDGVTFAIQPGPEFSILYTNELAEDDMCMATPVIVDDKLLIRSARGCIAFRTAPPNRRPPGSEWRRPRGGGERAHRYAVKALGRVRAPGYLPCAAMLRNGAVRRYWPYDERCTASPE